ncbi:MAG TPA: glycosyltransferase family 2 protein [Candidatus Angelobacter sp.]|jgi:cellulose synthase/poly-beta-1,6-N-acetylglucosamine synthase-like glycosyltransferase|nr:glycosyltransferase family 2 protein [Candidatus Angelobacter sp.]
MLLQLFGIVILLICIYTVRHYCFTLNRVMGSQRHPYIDIDTADWPAVTVLIAAHNEEAVIADILRALLEVDYPQNKLFIVPVNDRSKDRTREIIDDFVERYPGRINPFHRTGGKPGKAAALKEAMSYVRTDLFLVFDADYIPGKALIRQLVAPFFDPEVGSVMGRVVPLNVGKKLLTRLLDLERSGGYQVDQQARMNLRFVPQYGGTVAGIRKDALDEIGGWNENTLAEDTDLTFRLLMAGWKTVYENRAECYEEVPERWPVRIRQIMRWAKGHNQAMVQYAAALSHRKDVSWWERLDGILLLGVYAMAPVLMLGWLLALMLFYTGAPIGGGVAVLGLAAFTTLGNFAAFFEIAAATRLDGSRLRIRLLPFTFLGFSVSLVSVSRAAWQQIIEPLLGKEMVWHKTERSRVAPVAAEGSSA